MLRKVLLLSSILLMMSSFAAAETMEELYQRVFGTAPPRSVQTLDVLVELDHQFIGEYVAEVDTVSLEATFQDPKLKVLLKNQLLPEYQSEVNALFRGNKLDTEILKSKGYQVIYHQRHLVFSLLTPAEKRKSLTIDFSKTKVSSGIKKFETPSESVSGFMNFFPELKYKSGKLEPSRLRMNGKSHYQNWVLESGGSVEYNQDKGNLSVTQMNLLREFEETGQELKIGKLNFNETVDGLDSSFLGASFKSRSDLQEVRAEKRIQYDLKLDEKSQVSIRVNGTPFKEMELEAGDYVLTGFPLQETDNEVEIEVVELDPPAQIEKTPLYAKGRKLLVPYSLLAVERAGRQDIVNYTTQLGDSFKSISQRFYGDFERTISLFEANQFHKKKGVMGQFFLRIPEWRKGKLYIINNQDTLESIARKTLGYTSDWKYIVRQNPELLTKPLNVGSNIKIPKVYFEKDKTNNAQYFDYYVTGDDTLWNVAERITGDGKNWQELYEHNRNTFVETQRHQVAYFYDSKVLQPGQTEYSYDVGYGHDLTNVLKPQLDQPVSLVSQRIGLTNHLTLGGYVAQTDHQLWGVNSLVALSSGHMSTFLSRVEAPGDPYRLKTQFASRTLPTGSWVRQYTLDYGLTTGDYFKAINPSSTTQLAEQEAGLGLNMALFSDTLMSFRQFYKWQGDSEESGQRLSFKKLFDTVSWSLNYQQSVKNGVRDWTAFASVSVLSFGGRLNTTVQQNLDDGSTSYGLNYTEQNYRVGSVIQDEENYDVQVEVRTDDQSLGVSQSQSGNTVSQVVSHQYDHDRFYANTNLLATNRDGAEPNGSLRLGTAIAYADGVAAISKPINNSFLIVHLPKRLDGHYVKLRGGNIDLFGPAVIRDLRTNEVSSIPIQDEDLPVGVDLGSRQIYAKARYGAGKAVMIGASGSVLFEAVVKDQNGEGYKHLSGEMVSMEDENQKQLFFTSRSGKVQISGLKPGQYRMVFFKSFLKPTIIDIPDNYDGILEYGDINVKEE